MFNLFNCNLLIKLSESECMKQKYYKEYSNLIHLPDSPSLKRAVNLLYNI